MIQELERAQARLDHIRIVEPILSALRTISLGSWRAALKQSAGVRRYGERLAAILPLLVPHLPVSGGDRLSASKIVLRGWSNPRFGPGFDNPGRAGAALSRLAVGRANGEKYPIPERAVILVVGSERGLCGRFNTAVVERAERYLSEQEANGAQVERMALGSRVRRLIERGQRPLAWSGALSVAALPPFHLAFDLTRGWLARYEEGELDTVDLVYNAYRGTGRYEPTVARLIPPQLPSDRQGTQGKPFDNAQDRPWPLPIIETDPLSLYARVVEQWAAVKLYEWLLDSAAAEHSTRYQLMESATQNAERLIGELTLVVQAAKQQGITQEMQELAAGAGLIGPQQRGTSQRGTPRR
jgi:F-type H+-transporting ATPase subunit gamma